MMQFRYIQPILPVKRRPRKQLIDYTRKQLLCTMLKSSSVPKTCMDGVVTAASNSMGNLHKSIANVLSKIYEAQNALK